MATVRDPAFWRRFSVAVHQDDAAKEEMAKRPDLKHSYVSSQSSSSHRTASEALPSPITTPTSQSHLSPASFRPCTQPPPPPQPLSPGPSPLQAFSPPAPTTPTTTPKRQPSRLHKTKPLNSNSRSPKSFKSPPKSPRRPSLVHNPFRHTNASQLTLGLSGRPSSRFKFWTSVTADPSNRDSWLESQRKKKQQRTWMCWAFWLCFAVLVAGIVITILLLKAKKII